MYFDRLRNQSFRKDNLQGAAWLSSARAVRCWVKSCNERNPYAYLPAHYGGNYKQTACESSEEGRDEVKSSWLLRLGLHTCYNGVYSGSLPSNGSPILKTRLSSDWGLQFDPMKLESLVIAHQQWRGEYVLGPCTHCPSSHGSQRDPKTVTVKRAVKG